jgi:hypothetical protein
MALLLTAPALLAANGNGSALFTTTISGPAQPVAEGAEVRIHVVLTNVSEQTIFVQSPPGSGQAEAYYTVQVWDEHGAEAKMTDYGRAARSQRFGGSQSLTGVPPGGKFEQDTLVGKQFDMSAPGDYTIQLSRAFSHDPKDGSILAVKGLHEPIDGIVKSNQITVTVVPD